MHTADSMTQSGLKPQAGGQLTFEQELHLISVATYRTQIENECPEVFESIIYVGYASKSGLLWFKYTLSADAQ